MDEEAGVGADAQGDLCRPLEGSCDEGAVWDPEAMSDLSYEPSFASDQPRESAAQSTATAPFSLVPSLQNPDQLTPSAVEMIGHSGASQPASGQGAADLENLLRVTHASQPPEIPKFVWQEEFWSDLFHPEKSLTSFVPEPVFTRFDLPSQDALMPAEVTLERPEKRGRNFGPRVFMKVVLNRMVVSWRDQREADLSRALTKWSAVFDAWDNFEVSIVQQLAECSSPEARESLLGDYLARKAPSTCLKRANSIRRLNSRAAENSLSMPLGEPELYKVLCDAKAGGASLSELRGIMEAVTFVRFTFDVEQFSSCAKSRRCWGLSSAKRAQLVTRADPMRVVDILELHRILDQGEDLWDRLMCGAALCCIYCRGRWNDVQHVDNWTLELNDEGHVEFASAVIDIHKTMFFASKAPKVMELIAPGAGVAEGCWVSAFLQVRELLGATYKEGYPTMPAPDKSGLPTVRALSSGEAGAWLRSMLPEREGMRTTSHSLKSTLLSYAAKRGISHLDRLCLGGHTHKDTSMADVYARDAMARPLRLLAGMLSEIRSGAFLPDASRAARFPGRVNEARLEEDQAELRLGPLTATAEGSARAVSSGLEIPGVIKVDSESDDDGGHDHEPPSPAVSGDSLLRGLSPALDEHANLEAEDIASVDPGAGVSSSGETSSESSSSDTGDDEPNVPRMMLPPAPPEGTYFIQRRKLRTLHMMLNGHKAVTVCGRSVDPQGPMAEPSNLRYDTPVCKQCKRSLQSVLP